MIYTSYFARIKTTLPAGLRAVSIALRNPEGWPLDDTCPSLVPPPFLLDQWRGGNLTEAGYETRYREFRLRNLSAKWILSYYDNCVLTCYESPEKFCHRHIVRRWIQETAGVDVQELGETSTPVPASHAREFKEVRDVKVQAIQLSLF
jgi:hypothetical protein